MCTPNTAHKQSSNTEQWVVAYQTMRLLEMPIFSDQAQGYQTYYYSLMSQRPMSNLYIWRHARPVTEE